MSKPNEGPDRIDYQETPDVTEVHAAVQREKPEPSAEVTPIRSVDKISVGKGTVGPITKAIQKEFYAIVQGEKHDKYKWLTPVAVGSKQPVGV